MRFEYLFSIKLQLFLLYRDTHALAAQHIAGPNEYRISNFICNFDCAVHVLSRSVRREGDVQVLQEGRKGATVFRKVYHLKVGAEDLNSFFYKTLAYIKSCLYSNLQYTAFRRFV